jgi:hypothetical protein
VLSRAFAIPGAIFDVRGKSEQAHIVTIEAQPGDLLGCEPYIDSGYYDRCAAEATEVYSGLGMMQA